MSKVISAGILVKYGNKYVLGHATGQSWYDIFKGRNEEGESILQTAIRECEEESSLVFSGSEMKYLGLNDYLPGKDLAVFVARNDNLDINDLKCTILMENGEPEMDYYILVSYDEMLSKVGKSMRKVLKFLERDIKSF